MAEQGLVVQARTQAPSQAASLALVQIFLNVSLACIAHARELIPWKSPCFSTRYIDHINLHTQPDGQSLYSSFQAAASRQAGEGQEVKILIQGGHRRADQILNMLEKGVFDALGRGYLEDLQVFVTKASQRGLSVVETYHFAFAYDKGHVRSIRVSPTDHTFFLEYAHKSFKAATRALLRSLRDLPRLPARRKFGMTLAYNKTCPPLYQPPGFVDKDDFQGREGASQAICDAILAGGEDIVGTLETGRHQVQVKVLLSDYDAHEPSVDIQDTGLSEQLQAMQKTSSSRSNNLLSTLRESTPTLKRHGNAPTTNGKRRKIDALKFSSTKASVPWTSPAVTRESSPGGRNTTRLEQHSLGPAQVAVDLGPTLSDFTQETGACLDSTKMAELLIHCCAVQNGAKGIVDGAVFDQDLLAEGKIKRLVRSDHVSCECGSHRSLRMMLYCDVCDGWQHRDCYGYANAAAASSTTTGHFCYTCLLFSENEECRQSPLSIILLRKAVHYLTAQVESGTRIDENVLLAGLRPPRWTREVLDLVMDRLVEVQVLSRRDGGAFEVRPLTELDLTQIKDECTSPLASIQDLFVTPSGVQDGLQYKRELLQALAAYAHGQDYTTGEGCGRMLSRDEFGASVLRWGYRHRPSLTNNQPEANFLPEAATPLRRRKISISRLLISVDCSPSAASETDMEERRGQCPDEDAFKTDFKVKQNVCIRTTGGVDPGADS